MTLTACVESAESFIFHNYPTNLLLLLILILLYYHHNKRRTMEFGGAKPPAKRG